uniref:Uncharacterized protein n=2 Tax=Eptatretus burgeri TaxID=7764 RepID=A0A8C4R5L0_EPTBU
MNKHTNKDTNKQTFFLYILDYLTEQVQQEFGATLQHVVAACVEHPLVHLTSLAVLCTAPYSRAEESTVLLSGLVKQLDWLISKEGRRSQALGGAIPWRAFCVLTSCCKKWDEDTAVALPSVGLTRELAGVLTRRLEEPDVGSRHFYSYLVLLQELSSYPLGIHILHQPSVISRLLLSFSLIFQPPNISLLAISLTRQALPYLSPALLSQLSFPPTHQLKKGKSEMEGCKVKEQEGLKAACQLVSVLLEKLADFLSPDCPSPCLSFPEVADNEEGKWGEDSHEWEVVNNIGKSENERLSVFLHKRHGQRALDALQPFISESDEVGLLGFDISNLEKKKRMAEELTKIGYCELQTGNASFAVRLAEKLASLGHPVSLWPSKPQHSQQLISPSTLITPQYRSFPTTLSVSETPNLQTTPHLPSSSTAPLAPKVSTSAVDAGMKAELEAQWAVCQKKNMKITSDSKRFYMSADVSDSLAAQLMQILTSLLSSPHAKSLWEPAFHMVLSDALSEIPLFGEYLSSISKDREPGELLETTKHEELEMGSNELEMAFIVSVRRASAALALLGGYREILKAGSKVLVTGLSEYQGEVISLSSDFSTASVCFVNSSSTESPSFIPTSRLSVKEFEPLPLTRLGLAPVLSRSLFSLLLPTVSGLPLSAPLPSPPTICIALSRLLADIRIRALQTMCKWILEPELQEEMARECPAAMDILHLMANECSPGERLSMVDRQRQTLRQLYIDTVRPTPPPPPLECTQLHDMTWDLQRDFPPPRGCVLSMSLSRVLFLGENERPRINLPRGCFLYASCPIPAKAPSFYWELEVISFGERHGGEDGPILSFGLAPSAEPSPLSWKNPMGSVGGG